MKKYIFLILSFIAMPSTLLLLAASMAAPILTVEQRTNILKQDPYKNLCGYYALWNIYADQNEKNLANHHAFAGFKGRYQSLCKTSESSLNDMELWQIIAKAKIENVIVIPNGDFLSCDSQVASEHLQAIYEGDGHDDHLTQTSLNYNDGEKIYCIINPRHVSIGERSGTNGIGHWFVMTLQKTETGNHVTILESLPAEVEDISLDALIAQKLAAGHEDIDTALEEAKKELAGVDASSGYEGFIDRRIDWPANLASFITALFHQVDDVHTAAIIDFSSFSTPHKKQDDMKKNLNMLFPSLKTIIPLLFGLIITYYVAGLSYP